jgi:hypothetical protein
MRRFAPACLFVFGSLWQTFACQHEKRSFRGLHPLRVGSFVQIDAAFVQTFHSFDPQGATRSLCMTRRVYKFILKTLKEVSFVGTRYYPVDIDSSLSPYTTVLATIWDEDHMVGQVNQTEILAWWSEVYEEPKREMALLCASPELEGHPEAAAGKSESVLQARNM